VEPRGGRPCDTVAGCAGSECASFIVDHGALHMTWASAKSGKSVGVLCLMVLRAPAAVTALDTAMITVATVRLGNSVKSMLNERSRRLLIASC